MRLRNRERFCVATPYDCLTAVGLLRSCTASHRGGGSSACFTGDIPYGGTAFTLRPVCHGRNSWLPELRCTVTPAESGSVLTVEARCHWFTRGFMAVWYGGLLLFALGGRLAGLLPGLLMALAMLVFGFGLSHAAFRWPLDRAKKDLCRTLRGEIVK